jgi:hypothetical protein
LLAIIVAAVPSLAQARPASVYPIDGEGVANAQLRDVEGMIKSALMRLRSGVLTLVDTASLPPACGSARTAQPACLARLARTGIVLQGLVGSEGRRFWLSLSAVDGAGRRYGPARVAIDLSIENLQPIVAALELLGTAIAEGRGAAPSAPAAPPPAPLATASAAAPAARPATVPAAPTPPPAPQATAAPAPRPAPQAAASAAPTPGPPAASLPAGAAASAPAVTAWLSAPAPPPVPAASVARVPARQPAPPAVEWAWMAPTGKWLLAGGAVALAGGTAAGFLGKRLNNELAGKYQAHTLTAADSASYKAVHRYALNANSLFIAGGVLALTGLTLWGLAADLDGDAGGMRIALAGRF